jgi:HlyD family secretion protein
LIGVGQTARLEVDAFRDRKFAGQVTEIANSSKTTAGGGSSQQEATKFEVKIRIKEKEIFRPGMSISAEIETRYRTNVLTVPIGSVTTRLPKDAAAKKTGDPKKDKTPGKPDATNALASANAKTNASPATNSVSTQSGSTNAATGTNLTKANGTKKPGEAPKPIEVVFVNEDSKAKMVPVKRGISDENYVEIVDGLKEGQEVVSGGYKAISRELEDGKKIKIGPAKNEPGKETKT